MPWKVRTQAGRPGDSMWNGGEGVDEVAVRAQTDSDWAGNRKTRKSVNGGALYFGGHLVRSWSKEQSGQKKWNMLRLHHS